MCTQDKRFRLAGFYLRVIALPATLTSLCVMAINKQENDDYGKVEFQNISGLKYLVSINAMACSYAVASVLLSSIAWFNTDRLFVISDQVVAYLMVTSVSAVAQLLHLLQKGDKKVAWSEVCSYYSKFCNGIKVSLALHFVGLVCFIMLTLISAYLVFSKFDAPASEEVVVEQGH